MPECVCVHCLRKAPVCDLTVEYISHLDKNSRFTVTILQQHKPRTRINPVEPRHSFVKQQIVWIHSSFSYVLWEAVIVRSKVDFFLWEFIPLVVIPLKNKNQGGVNSE